MVIHSAVFLLTVYHAIHLLTGNTLDIIPSDSRASCASVPDLEANNTIQNGSCAFPYLYSVQEGRCQPFSEVTCDNRYEPISPCDYPDASCRRPAGDDVSLCTCAKVPDLNYDLCRNRSNGDHAWPARLWSPYYVRCTSHRTLPQQCPQSSVIFDFLDNKCQYVYEVVNQAYSMSMYVSIPASLRVLLSTGRQPSMFTPLTLDPNIVNSLSYTSSETLLNPPVIKSTEALSTESTSSIIEEMTNNFSEHLTLSSRNSWTLSAVDSIAPSVYITPTSALEGLTWTRSLFPVSISPTSASSRATNVLLPSSLLSPVSSTGLSMSSSSLSEAPMSTSTYVILSQEASHSVTAPPPTPSSSSISLISLPLSSQYSQNLLSSTVSISATRPSTSPALLSLALSVSLSKLPLASSSPIVITPTSIASSVSSLSTSKLSSPSQTPPSIVSSISMTLPLPLSPAVSSTIPPTSPLSYSIQQSSSSPLSSSSTSSSSSSSSSSSYAGQTLSVSHVSLLLPSSAQTSLAQVSTGGSSTALVLPPSSVTIPASSSEFTTGLPAVSTGELPDSISPRQSSSQLVSTTGETLSATSSKVLPVLSSGTFMDTSMWQSRSSISHMTTVSTTSSLEESLRFTSTLPSQTMATQISDSVESLSTPTIHPSMPTSSVIVANSANSDVVGPKESLATRTIHPSYSLPISSVIAVNSANSDTVGPTDASLTFLHTTTSSSGPPEHSSQLAMTHLDNRANSQPVNSDKDVAITIALSVGAGVVFIIIIAVVSLFLRRKALSDTRQMSGVYTESIETL